MSSVSEHARAMVRDLVRGVTPLDDREAADRQWILDWIDSGAPLFRVEKPATPPQHLAVYAALLDEDTQSVMLVDHVKAKAWLFPGGHVDADEDPRQCVVRELGEELAISPQFHTLAGSAPFFLTVTQTRGAHSHTDVTLWFVFKADRQAQITPDPAEFSAVHWFPLNRETGWCADQFDPGMARFVRKLSSAFDRVAAG